MLETRKLIETNTGSNRLKVSIKDSKWFYRERNKRIGFFELNELSKFINKITAPYMIKLPVVIDFRNNIFSDKLCYMLFECMCYEMILRGCKVVVSLPTLTQKTVNIYNEGFKYSPINHLCNFNENSYAQFQNKFKKDISNLHFRRLISCENNDKSVISKLMGDISIFLRGTSVPYVYSEEISDVLSELVDNALDHSQTDCIIDIDVTNEYSKNTDPDGNYYGINSAVINFSQKLLGEDIEILYNAGVENSQYNKLGEAIKNHSMFFDEYYTKEDFFIMAAFQNKISGRRIDYATGGTGLTKLIKSLEMRSDAYDCYTITGNRILKFQHEFLDFDENQWVGFNKENDFINFPPDKSNIGRSSMFIPGTAFNLNFVVKGD